MAVVIPTKPTSGLPNDERGMWDDEGHGAPDWGCCQWEEECQRGDGVMGVMGVEMKASRDFTLDEYGVLCESVLSSGYMAYDIYNHLSKTTDNEEESALICINRTPRVFTGQHIDREIIVADNSADRGYEWT